MDLHRVHLRPMLADDIPAGLRLCRLSGWNQLEDDWLAFLVSPDGGGWVAEEKAVVLGTVTYLRFPGCFSWVAMMMVDPSSRGGGVGAQLLEAALDSLRADNCVRLDASPAGEHLYRRYGFVPEYRLERAGTLVAQPSPVRSSAVIRPIQREEMPEILAWDRETFGADRSTVLSSFLSRAPELAWTARFDGRLAGYTFGRPGHLSAQVGPVTAVDEEVAGQMVQACLGTQVGRRVAMDVPADAPRWIEWLRAAGFGTERPFLRMRLGSPAPGRAASQFAIAGPEFG